MRGNAMTRKTSIEPAKGARKAVARQVAADRATSRKTESKLHRRQAAKPVLLAGDNPQIVKGNGDAPVQAYIAAIPGWKRGVGRRLDALIGRTVPGVRRAIKWNSPFYGAGGQEEGGGQRQGNRQSWFLSFHCFAKYVKVAFFRGASLRPLPPGESKQKDVRYFDIHEGEFDEAQLEAWVKQASRLPGVTM
jgi:hypothetical protein